VRPAHEPPPVPAAPTAASETAPSVPPPPPSAAVPPPAGPTVVVVPAPSQGRLLGAGIALFLLGILVGLLLLTVRPWIWWQKSSVLAERAMNDTVTQGLTEERDRLRTLMGGDVCTVPPDRLPGRLLEQPPKPSRPGRLGEMSPPATPPLATPTPPAVMPPMEAKPADPPLQSPPIVRKQRTVDPPAVTETKPLPLPPCDTIEVPAQVMLAMDTSGSMSLPAGNRPDILEMERKAAAGDAYEGRKLEALMKQPGRKRMDDARDAANELIGSLSRKAAVGIASFDGQCETKIDVVPTLDRSQTKRVIEAFKPGGRTPIAATLRRVRDAFGTEGDPDTPRSVILITDGEETCMGDPCGEARELAQAYKNLKIHVIDVTGTSQLQCLADVTKGTIVKAGDLEELKAAVARAATGVHQQMNCAPPGGMPGGAPGTSPGVPQRHGAAGRGAGNQGLVLKMPEKPTTDLSFLKGCWQTEPFKHSRDHDESVSTYCFDERGEGWLENSGISSFCRPSARARYSGDELKIDDSDCPPVWAADHLVCRRAGDGVALCSGTSIVPGTKENLQWTVRLHRRTDRR